MSKRHLKIIDSGLPQWLTLSGSNYQRQGQIPVVPKSFQPLMFDLYRCKSSIWLFWSLTAH